MARDSGRGPDVNSDRSHRRNQQATYGARVIPVVRGGVSPMRSSTDSLREGIARALQRLTSNAGPSASLAAARMAREQLKDAGRGIKASDGYRKLPLYYHHHYHYHFYGRS